MNKLKNYIEETTRSAAVAIIATVALHLIFSFIFYLSIKRDLGQYQKHIEKQIILHKETNHGNRTN